MLIKLSQLLNIYKSYELDNYIKELTGFTLNERNLTDEKIKNYWSFVGDNPSNGSIINMLKYPEKGIIERLTNGIDAVLEKEKKLQIIKSAKNADVIVKKAFPKFYENKQKVINGVSTSIKAYESMGKVVLSINDGSRSNKPTIDIIDQGEGIEGKEFINTILSINKGNKLSSDKNYLIGAFGQGGSTSLPHSYATIIVSKYNDKFYATVIKSVELSQYKNFVFVYMNENGKINECEIGNLDMIEDEQVKSFIRNESGTLVRMIETDIAKEYRSNDIAKPGMLGDYVNTELFNVPLPIKMIENRSDYKINKHAQNRNSFGSYSKLYSWKYSRTELNGKISILHNQNSYDINYYIILPEDEAKWGSDNECKKVYNQFNVHSDPIIYIVNGQYVSSEKFTKLKNVGLSFLQYRLLVVINLDVLGIEKYKFFTSDRAGIRSSDLTRGFIDTVIDALKREDAILAINETIANKSINSQVDDDMLKDISSEVKSIYKKFLKSGNLINGGNPNGGRNVPKHEEIFEDHIKRLEVITSKEIFYKNEDVKITLYTGARKSVNEESLIIAFFDDKACYANVPNFMNGRIQYLFSENSLGPGEHEVVFRYFKCDTIAMESNIYKFELSNEIIKEKTIINNRSLDLDVHIVEEKELIIQVSKNKENKKIDAYLCMNHYLMREVYGKNRNTDAIQLLKNKLIKPILLYVLFLNDAYEELESDEKRNEFVLSFAKTMAISL